MKEAEGKMLRWIENGVQLGWMVNPYARTVVVYEAGGETRIEAGDKVVGTGPVHGFALELDDVLRSYRL